MLPGFPFVVRHERQDHPAAEFRVEVLDRGDKPPGIELNETHEIGVVARQKLLAVAPGFPAVGASDGPEFQAALGIRLAFFIVPAEDVVGHVEIDHDNRPVARLNELARMAAVVDVEPRGDFVADRLPGFPAVGALAQHVPVNDQQRAVAELFEGPVVGNVQLFAHRMQPQGRFLGRGHARQTQAKRRRTHHHMSHRISLP